MPGVSQAKIYRGQDASFDVVFGGADDVTAWAVVARFFSVTGSGDAASFVKIGSDIPASSVDAAAKTWSHVMPSALSNQTPGTNYRVEIWRTNSGQLTPLAIIMAEVVADGWFGAP